MAKFYKQNFNKEGKPLQRQLVFLGQHDLEVDSGTGFHDEDVVIEVEGENTAFSLVLSADEARKVRGYLDKMGY